MSQQRPDNFSSGPAALPAQVLDQIQKDMWNWRGKGASIMEISHRDPAVLELGTEVEQKFRDLMNIPDSYHVLFIQGGGRGQYGMIPMNFMKQSLPVDYAVTGYWSSVAVKEAERFAPVNRVVDKEGDGFISIPHQSEWNRSQDAAYLHIVDNETIHGVEFPSAPDRQGVPLISDMTSNILSRPMKIENYDMVYAACQKNIGIAGLSVSIINSNIIQEPIFKTSMLTDYRTYIEHKSYYNTPPTFALYVTGLMLDWIKEKGGADAFGEINQRKSAKLYDFIDNSSFYINKVETSCRSRMNIPFVIEKTNLMSDFIDQAGQNGLIGLKGHPVVGGLRAGLYNVIDEDAVDRLISFMKRFERENR